MTIFSYLDASDLLHAAGVCRLWYTVSSNNIIWKSLYSRYMTRARAKSRLLPRVPEAPDGEHPLSFWKKACISSCIEFRDRRAISSLNDRDAFSGLPKNACKAIRQAGIRFRLALVDGSGSSHFYDPRDTFYHAMSIAVRWYSLDFVPVGRIVKLRVYAACPIIFDCKGEACRNSPVQMTLLDEKDVAWLRDPKRDAAELCSSDKMVNTYIMTGGCIVATWKEGGELAYVALNLPLNNLVQRCLPASAAAAAVAAAAYMQPARRAAAGSLNEAALAIAARSYAGLNTCQCAVELRTYRKSLWKEQFLNLDYDVSGRGGSRLPADGATITVIKDSGGHSTFRLQEQPQLTWATDLFKDITPDLCILDLTLMEGLGIVWCISCPVKLKPMEKTEVSFDRPGKEYAITWSDHIGSVSMELSEEVDDTLLTVKHLVISLRTSTLLQLFSSLVGHPP